MLEALVAIPFIGRAVAFVTSKTRLVIEYVLIALLLTSAGVALTLWVRTDGLENNNEALQVRVSHSESVNEAQDRTISLLQDLRRRDAALMKGLADDYSTLAKSDVSARKKLAALEKRNESVRSYLEQPVPDELVCLLNVTCTPRAAAPPKDSPASRPTGEVPGARPPDN